MAKHKKPCSVFSLQCDSCLIRHVFDFVSPLIISPIKGVCEKWGSYDNPFETSKLRMLWSLTLATVTTAGFCGYLPLIYAAWHTDTKECLQLITEAFCCLLGFVANYTNVVIPHMRMNNMHAWHKLIKKCKLYGYYNIAITFQGNVKKYLAFAIIASFIPPIIMLVMRMYLLRNESFWLLRVFAVPFNVHLQLVIVFRHILILQFLLSIYDTAHSQTSSCLLRCIQSIIPTERRDDGNCRKLRELNRLYSALYFNTTDFTERISSKFSLWFGSALLTLITNIYSIVLLSDAKEIVQEVFAFKCQAILLIVMAIYLLNEIQRLHDVVRDNNLNAHDLFEMTFM